PLRQASVLRQEPLGLDELQLMLCSKLSRLLGDALGPFRRVQDDAVFTELLDVILEAVNPERRVAVNALAASCIAARHARDFKLDNLAIEKADDSMQWPHPRERLP